MQLIRCQTICKRLNFMQLGRIWHKIDDVNKSKNGGKYISFHRRHRLGKLIAGISTYSFIYLFIYYTHYLNWNENSFGNELLMEMLGRALE